MIGTSFHELVFIRCCIFLLQYSIPLELLVLVILHNSHAASPAATCAFAVLLALELLYSVFIYLPFKARLKTAAVHPPPLSRDERESVFARCLENVPDPERYLRLWSLGAHTSDIRRDNIRDFILWAFFDRPATGDNRDIEAEADDYVARTEAAFGWRFPPGRGAAAPLRLTLDAVETRYHSVVWQAIVACVDLATHCRMALHGFRYYSQPLRRTLAVFPPRPLAWLTGRRSPEPELGYWFRPARPGPGPGPGSPDDAARLPVVFIHGIGIGLHPYVTFLSQIPADTPVLAVEILPLSMRLVPGAPAASPERFAARLGSVLARHGIRGEFVLVGHSYGSVLAAHVLRSRQGALGRRVVGVVLLDPVSLLLHLPDVAFNFTRRRPRGANEWQLWYFASMDPGAALVLGRHFFWRENLLWKEELVGVLEAGDGGDDDDDDDDAADLLSPNPTSEEDGDQGVVDGAELGTDAKAKGTARRRRRRTRKAAVSLAGRDLITDTPTVARYLASAPGKPLSERPTAREDAELADVLERASAPDSAGLMTKSGVELLWFPKLDHAQVFEAAGDRERLLGVIRRFTLREN